MTYKVLRYGKEETRVVEEDIAEYVVVPTEEDKRSRFFCDIFVQ